VPYLSSQLKADLAVLNPAIRARMLALLAIGEVRMRDGLENETEMIRAIAARHEIVRHRLGAVHRLKMGAAEATGVEAMPARKLRGEVFGIQNRLVSLEDGSRVLLDRIRERQEREGVPLMAMSETPRRLDQIAVAMDQLQDRLKVDLL
jgi:hypothetical protein